MTTRSLASSRTDSAEAVVQLRCAVRTPLAPTLIAARVAAPKAVGGTFASACSIATAGASNATPPALGEIASSGYILNEKADWAIPLVAGGLATHTGHCRRTSSRCAKD